MSGHTKGPWTIKNFTMSGTASIGPDDGHGIVARVGLRMSKTNNTSERDANARLIAAAPEMLEALKAANAIMTTEFCGWGAALNQIRAAIAKAEGRET